MGIGLYATRLLPMNSHIGAIGDLSEELGRRPFAHHILIALQRPLCESKRAYALRQTPHGVTTSHVKLFISRAKFDFRSASSFSLAVIC